MQRKNMQLAPLRSPPLLDSEQQQPTSERKPGDASDALPSGSIKCIAPEKAPGPKADARREVDVAQGAAACKGEVFELTEADWKCDGA